MYAAKLVSSDIQPLTPLGRKGLSNTDLNVSLYFLAAAHKIFLERNKSLPNI